MNYMWDDIKWLVVISIIIFVVVHYVFKLIKTLKSTTATNLNSVQNQNQNKIFYSLWFWLIFMQLVYGLLNILFNNPLYPKSVLSYIPKFIGLFVPFGAISPFAFLFPPLLFVFFAGPLILIFLANRYLDKKNYGLRKIIVINLFILLILRLVIQLFN